MRLPVVVIAPLLLLFSTPSIAEAGAEASAAPPSKSAKHQVLVLDLEAIDVDTDKMKIINGTVVDVLSGFASLEIVAQADIRQMVDFEAEKQALGCDTSSCLAEIAGAMGAGYVVFGRVGRLDDMLFVQLNLFDSQKGRAVARQEVRAQRLSELPDLIRPALAHLTAPLTGQTPPPAPPATPAASSAEEASALPTVLLAAGGGVFGVGLLGAVGLAAGALWAEDKLGQLDASREEKTTAAGLGPLLFFGALGGGAVAAAGLGLAGAALFVE